MPIVSSTYTIDAHAQANGAHWCVERHTVSDGRVLTVGPYLLAAGQGDADAQTLMAERATNINSQLADAESMESVDKSATLSLLHQTVDQFCVRLWLRIQAARTAGDKEAWHRLVWRLHHYVLDGYISNAQARVSYNTVYEKSLTTAQWNNNMVPRLETISARYQAMLDEADL